MYICVSISDYANMGLFVCELCLLVTEFIFKNLFQSSSNPHLYSLETSENQSDFDMLLSLQGGILS